MEENKINKEEEKLINSDKLLWEAPKLYSLDKGKTEGGPYTRGDEDASYFYS